MAKSGAMPMGMDKDWQAECDLRCLIDAEKIKRDKKRYTAAMAAHKKMKADLEAVGKTKSA